MALFWNFGWPVGEVSAELDRVYARLAPGIATPMKMIGAGGERVDITVRAPAETARFGEPQISEFPWARRYSAAEWLDQLPTHSDHAALDPEHRARLLAAVAEVIAAHGGTIDVAYLARLVMARLTARAAIRAR